MMLTRAILLLLAMMTGLSAAQAEERLRPAQGSVGISRSQGEHSNAVAEMVADAAVAQQRSTETKYRILLATELQDRSSISAPIQTVYRSDRALE